MEECSHRRIKRNYPFGKKSYPTMKCKLCGKPIKPIDLEKKRIRYPFKKRS